MPSAASIAIADSVPVTRNYPPSSVSGYVASHVDVSTAATPAGQSSFTLKLKPATTTVARRVDMTFVLPVEYTDSTTGNILVKDTFRFSGGWVVPPSATALQVANFEALVRNLIANATVQGYVKTGANEY